VALLGAGLLFVFNPYVVQFTSRGSVALIAYAALPWLMLAAHRGARRPRGWRWPAFVALVLAASGGGVNAALIAFMLLGPAGLLAYDCFTRVLRWRAAWSFAWRAGLLGALASAWWAIPVLLQSRYGADFLSFTEQPGTIWATTSLSEGLRELGFWGMYVGAGFGHQEPFISTAHYYLFNAVVLCGSFLVPLFAVAGLRMARAWRYAAFFGVLAAVTLVVMAAGFPEGTPLRHALNFAYSNFPAGRFLRTTYKAAPLLVLAFACLGGAAAAVVVDRMRGRARGLRRLYPVGLVAVPVLAGLPLLLGTALDREQVYHLPTAWPQAVGDATAAAGPNARTAVVPGEIFGWYRWGGTMDPVGPALARRPVAIREVVPYADQRSAQLQTVVDDLVQQDRLVPGQLAQLLRLMGVSQLLVATDSDRRRSGALDPVGAAVALDREPRLDRSTEHYGAAHLFKPKPQRTGPRLVLAQLRRYALANGAQMVRLESDSGATVVDGDADGVASLAGLSSLDPSSALFYAADVAPPALRRLVGEGARLVLTDSLRRQAVVSSRTRLNRGPTLTDSAPIKSGFTRYLPFGEPAADEQTVAVYSTLRRLYAPALPAFKQFAERRAYAVFDGRRGTTWLADPILDPDKRYVEATLRRPLRVASIQVFPHEDRLGGTQRVAVRFNGGDEHEFGVSPSGTRIPVPGGVLRSLRVRVAKTHNVGRKPVAGGLDEVRVPGLVVHEWLRMPSALAGATRGLDLSGNDIDVALDRQTADFPRRTGRRIRPAQDVDPVDAVDPEDGIERQVSLPVARSFGVRGWASVGPQSPDDAIDRLVGLPGGWRMTSSSRFEGVPSRRASSAFDRDPRRAWVGDVRHPWIALRAPRPLALRRFVLVPGPAEYARPTSVRVNGVAARVGPGGAVDLGRRLRSRSFRLEITGRTGVKVLPAVAIAELRAPGLHPPAPRRAGTFRTSCGALDLRAVGTAPAPLLVSGSVRDLDDGEALRLRGCGKPLRLAAGSTLIGSPPGKVMRADRLLLHSAAPAGRAAPAPSAGRVSSVSGDDPLGVPQRARLDVRRPAWLVLGQSWSRGWHATCRDASGHSTDLGEPLPIDGFANGWLVQPGCVEATFSFPPQRL
ncbi:MAG: arabinofuranan 3-O-arabinosyltransferase, partial [Thermoleophilaceae bacterium]|nr:arabinofuranan 3-O-arabinosyltransferase [Thermoleophilaceae bacterium]